MSDSNELSVAEAAARLGVKHSTLYAYVSRGYLHRRVGPDGRSSRFDAAEVDALRSGRRRKAEGELDAVISTALTSVRDGVFKVRGVDVVETVANGAGFEESVALLWGVERLGSCELSESTARAIERTQASLPESASLVDRLRVTAVLASAADPLRFDLSASAVQAVGRGLLVAMIEGLPCAGRSLGQSNPRLAERLWPRLTSRRANADRRRVLDAALALLVDHGLATSTFGARIAASVRADPYSVILASLGVVGGIRHGRASAAVHELLADADRRSDPVAAVGEALRRDGGVPGYGHAVYRSGDPRYAILHDLLAAAWSGDSRLTTFHAVTDVVSSRTEASPNVDLALGALTYLAGMPVEAGEAIFAIARTAGWIAHAIEEYAEPALRFRPSARYRGVR